MKQIYTGKIESATFSNPPENSTIEFLWRDEDQLVANQIIVNFSDPEFLAFIEEYPLEKIEKAARAAAAKRAKIKRDYDQKIIDEYIKKIPPVPPVPEIDILDHIDKNNKNKDIIFDLKLKILDAFTSKPKNKALQLKIRKAKTLKELLGLYYGV